MADIFQRLGRPSIMDYSRSCLHCVSFQLIERRGSGRTIKLLSWSGSCVVPDLSGMKIRWALLVLLSAPNGRTRWTADGAQPGPKISHRRVSRPIEGTSCDQFFLIVLARPRKSAVGPILVIAAMLCGVAGHLIIQGYRPFPPSF